MLGLRATELTRFGNKSGRELSASRIEAGKLSFGFDCLALVRSLDISPAVRRARALNEGAG